MSVTPTTRRIHLLRHAKSSWDDPALDDHDRPLARRGLKASARLARWIRESNVRPGLVLCSTAVRARETLVRIEPALEAPAVVFEAGLYHAWADDLLARLQTVADDVAEVLLVGHNPGLEELCMLLAAPGELRDRVVVDLPTGALATLEAQVGRWADLAPAGATLIEVVLPRELGRG